MVAVAVGVGVAVAVGAGEVAVGVGVGVVVAVGVAVAVVVAVVTPVILVRGSRAYHTSSTCVTVAGRAGTAIVTTRARAEQRAKRPCRQRPCMEAAEYDWRTWGSE